MKDLNLIATMTSFNISSKAGANSLSSLDDSVPNDSTGTQAKVLATVTGERIESIVVRKVSRKKFVIRSWTDTKSVGLVKNRRSQLV